ncbi:MAG: hypothetical protein HYV27_15220 [Candidatus Hydrogenedentes bacterium]|nr:hypothetical protein [Candidatus Hydrogenedentota bacterium]
MHELTAEEREAMRSALARRNGGIPLTQEDRRWLRKAEKLHAQALRIQVFKAVPKGEYADISGRQVKVLNEQASRYGLPLAGATVDLTVLIPRFHDFLAENRYKLRAPEEEDPLLAGAVSPGLEKYRNHKAAREEIRLREDLAQSIPREDVKAGFGLVAQRLRRLGDKLADLYGEEARGVLEACLEDCAVAVRELLGADDE